MEGNLAVYILFCLDFFVDVSYPYKIGYLRCNFFVDYFRRHLMGVSQFVSLLFLIIQGNLQSVASEIRVNIHGLDSRKSRAGGDSLLFDEEHELLFLTSLPSSQQSVTREVAAILTQCSSSDNPLKIIQFLIPFLESLQAPLQFDETSCVNKLSYSEQYLKLSIALSSSIIIEKLMSPFIASATGMEIGQFDVEVHVIELFGLNELINTRKLFLKSLLWICRFIAELSIFKYVNKGNIHDTLLRPFIVFMTSAINRQFDIKDCTNSILDNQVQLLTSSVPSSLYSEYPLFALFVSEFKISWMSTESHDIKANMLHFLNLILEHALMIYLKSKYRDFIILFLSELLEPYFTQDDNSENRAVGNSIEKCIFIKDLGRSMMTA